MMPASTTPLPRRVPICLGRLGAMAADLLLQTFGLAALALSRRARVWGARALAGTHRAPMPCGALLAWPLGTLIVAAGLGILPAPSSLPAGAAA